MRGAVLAASTVDLLEASAGAPGDVFVRVAVNGCAYCENPKAGWHRRDGYWQEYIGWVDELKHPVDGCGGTFLLHAPRAVAAIRFTEVVSVEPV